MRTSCRNFRWKPSWCRSCLTQALCRETGTLPESDAVAILFLFGMSFKNYQNEFGNQLNPQGRFQEFCQRGSSHWIRRLDVAKEHYTKHQGVVRESFRKTMSGPNLTTGTFWCVHLRSRSQQVSRQIFIVFSFARFLDFHTKVQSFHLLFHYCSSSLPVNAVGWAWARTERMPEENVRENPRKNVRIDARHYNKEMSDRMSEYMPEHR